MWESVGGWREAGQEAKEGTVVPLEEPQVQGKEVLTLYFRPQGYNSFQAEKQTVVIEDDSGDKESIPGTGAPNVINNDNGRLHVIIISINLKTKLPSKLIYS